MLFVINKPDVFRAPGSDSYVIFGEAKVEDASASAQADAAAQFARPSAGARPGAGGIPAAAPTGGDDDDGDEDASGVEEKDIKVRGNLGACVSIPCCSCTSTRISSIACYIPFPLTFHFANYICAARHGPGRRGARQGYQGTQEE